MTSPQDLNTALSALFASDPAALDNPYPLYARLRSEAPVIRHGAIVAVSRYVDVNTILRDSAGFSSTRMYGSRLQALRAQTEPDLLWKLEDLVTHEALYMNESDGQDHARLRGLANYAFTPRRVAAIRATVIAVANELFDALEGQDQFDLVEAVAYPLPFRIIAGMLGATSERSNDIRRWSTEIGRAIGTDYSNIAEAHAALQEFRQFLRELIDERRAGEYDDLLGALVTAETEGSNLSNEELEAMFVLLLFAGHETTTNLISNSVRALLAHPEQMTALRADPELGPMAVEEFLRYCNSVQAVHRTATRHTEIAGTPIFIGETVRLLLASASHDETVFEQAEELDIRRDRRRSRHLAFGFGVHMCLGAWLARLETEVAIGVLLARYPGIEMAAPVAMRPNFLLSGPAQLMLRIRPRFISESVLVTTVRDTI